MIYTPQNTVKWRVNSEDTHNSMQGYHTAYTLTSTETVYLTIHCTHTPLPNLTHTHSHRCVDLQTHHREYETEHRSLQSSGWTVTWHVNKEPDTSQSVSPVSSLQPPARRPLSGGSMRVKVRVQFEDCFFFRSGCFQKVEMDLAKSYITHRHTCLINGKVNDDLCMGDYT